jgi:hypothetical protein
MAAAQRTGTSSDTSNITYSTANIDTLLNSFDAGDIITKAAVDTLLDYYADITDHQHTVVDLVNDKTFGNTGSSNNTTDTVDAASLSAIPADPGSGSTVTAAKHNEIRNAVNSLRGHVHSWTDNT